MTKNIEINKNNFGFFKIIIIIIIILFKNISRVIPRKRSTQEHVILYVSNTTF